MCEHAAKQVVNCSTWSQIVLVKAGVNLMVSSYRTENY